MDDNIGALKVRLNEEEVKEISDLIAENEVAGDRVFDGSLRCSWKFSTTPLKNEDTRKLPSDST